MACDYKDMSCSSQIYLQDQVKQWPTPAARDVAGISGSGRQARKGYPTDTLPNAVHVSQGKSWPTPTTRDYKGVPPDGYYRDGELQTDTIDRAVHAVSDGNSNGQLSPDWVEWLMGWPIGWTRLEPIELDERGWETDPADIGGGPVKGTTSDNLLPTPSASETGIRTKNYAQGGQPIGVAINKLGAGQGDIPRVATGIKARADRLKAIGNGQVPQAAELAWRILTK